MTWQYQVNAIYFLLIKLSNDFSYTLYLQQDTPGHHKSIWRCNRSGTHKTEVD